MGTRPALVDGLDVLKEAFDAISDIILVISPDYKILLANREFCHNYGLTSDEVEGVPYYRIVHGQDHPQEDCSCCRAIVSTIHEESEFNRFNRIFSTTASPIFEDGQIVALVHTITDITDIREQSRQAAINETMGAVCHELAQPMQVIAANISLLQGSGVALPVAVQMRLEIIKDTINEMGQMVKTLQNVGAGESVPSMVYNGNDRILDVRNANSRTGSAD